KACQDVVDHIAPPGYFLEALLEAEIGMKKAVEAKNSELAKELQDLRMHFLGLEVSNAQLSQQ
ncbi:hypothetical protein Tco_0466942, partial [Tanacetum coccineum]